MVFTFVKYYLHSIKSKSIKMKKLYIILLLSALTFFTVSAQNPPEPGGVQFNAGTGFSNWGIPLYIGLDFRVHPLISIGIESSFRSYNQSYTNTGYRSSIVGFSTNGNFHFSRLLDIPHFLDLYAGFNVGYYVWSTPSNYPGTGTSGIGVGGQIGGRYFISDHFGFNLEFGGGNAFTQVKFGLTYRF
jgi:outer membrane immunogenic protein